MDMDQRNPVSTPSLQVTEKDLATEEQIPEVLARLYRRVTGRLLLCGTTTTRCATSSERACTRNQTFIGHG